VGVARGYDSRGLVAGEQQQAALVAGHEVIWLAGFREGQQRIVARVGGEYQVRQPVDVLGELFTLIDQPTCLIGFDEIGDSRFCSVARNSSRCSTQVTRVNLPRSQAL